MTRLVVLTSAVALLLGGICPSAPANLITNGDFETWTNPPIDPTGNPDHLPDGWLRNLPDNLDQVSFSHAPGLDGSNNSLQINPGPTTARGVYQNFSPLDEFEISFDFAAAAPAAVGQFTLRATYRSGATVLGSPNANIRIVSNASGTGDLQIISGSSWQTPAGAAGAITFSDFDANDLAVYRLTLSGTVNTGSASTLKQSIRLYDVTNDDLLVDQDLGAGFWQTTPTSVPLQRLVFESTTAAHSSYRIDNVVVLGPEILDGDFNSDGRVDGHDFLTWQRNMEVGDLNDWKTNFGATSGGSGTLAVAAVPEPRAIGLGLLAMLLSHACSRRARSVCA